MNPERKTHKLEDLFILLHGALQKGSNDSDSDDEIASFSKRHKNFSSQILYTLVYSPRGLYDFL